MRVTNNYLPGHTPATDRLAGRVDPERRESFEQLQRDYQALLALRRELHSLRRVIRRCCDPRSAGGGL